MSILKQIKTLCPNTNDTLASLERKMGFGNGTINKWGQATPSADRLAKVADYFGVSMDYLLNREPTMEYSGLGDPYDRLARGAKSLHLTNEDVDAILNLYHKHTQHHR